MHFLFRLRAASYTRQESCTKNGCCMHNCETHPNPEALEKEKEHLESELNELRKFDGLDGRLAQLQTVQAFKKKSAMLEEKIAVLEKEKKQLEQLHAEHVFRGHARVSRGDFRP